MKFSTWTEGPDNDGAAGGRLETAGAIRLKGQAKAGSASGQSGMDRSHFPCQAYLGMVKTIASSLFGYGKWIIG